MTKQEQIEAMEEVIYNSVYKDCRLNNGGHCSDCKYNNYDTYGEDCQTVLIAEALYNAGYRKTFTSEFTSDTQKAYKEGYKKAIEDCKSEIERLKNYNDKLCHGEHLCDKIHQTKIQTVKDFADRLKEYARACKASGYDGIGENDIDELLKEFLCNTKD